MNERGLLIMPPLQRGGFNFSAHPSTRTFFVERPMGRLTITNIFKYLYTFQIVKIISFSLFHSGKYG